MPWHPDIPDFLTEKPQSLEKLEKLPSDIIHAMTGLEIDEHIRDAANGLAANYYTHCKKNKDYGYQECVLFVSSALSQTGSSLDSKLGLLMTGKSLESAKRACRQSFQDENDPFDL
jgi:hypothetical protein